MTNSIKRRLLESKLVGFIDVTVINGRIEGPQSAFFVDLDLHDYDVVEQINFLIRTSNEIKQHLISISRESSIKAFRHYEVSENYTKYDGLNVEVLIEEFENDDERFLQIFTSEKICVLTNYENIFTFNSLAFDEEEAEIIDFEEGMDVFCQLTKKS